MCSASNNARPPSVIQLNAHTTDTLEQVLSGCAPLTSLLDALVLVRNSQAQVMLLDNESTPVASINGGNIAQLRPLARGVGAEWDPVVRLSVRGVHDRYRFAPDQAIVALVVDSPPSLSDMNAALASLPSSGPRTLLLAALVSRASRPTRSEAPRVSTSGVVRSVIRAAQQFNASGHEIEVIPIAIPFPLEPSISLQEREAEIREVLIRYGAATFVIGRDHNLLTPDEIDQLLPLSSRDELSRIRTAPKFMPATIFFTGLSGSGKSTIARGVANRLHDVTTAEVVLLDGDEIRRRISQDLGFDRDSRNKNIGRIAEVAATIAASGGIAIAAPIAPFEEGRALARTIASSIAPFILVHVSTPLEVCEARDRKGLYAKARSGEVSDFTGISSPYEPPADADLVIDASVIPVETAVDLVLEVLAQKTGAHKDR